MTRSVLLLLVGLLSGLCVTSAGAQQSDCRCPWREYTAAPTPLVRQLFAAAERGDTTVFLRTLAQVPTPDAYALRERPLIAAIVSVRAWPAGMADARNRTYQTVSRMALDSLRAAHRASWPARERMLAAALARRVDPNAFTIHGTAPLILASVFGSPRMVEQLLDAGANANIEAPMRDDVNAIEYALEHEFPFRMQAFPEFVTVGERTAIIRRLLRAGTKAPWAGARFRMPAHSPWALVAALTEGDSVARELIAAGLTPTQLDVDGIPPITAAAQFGNVAVVRVLRDVGPRSARIVGDSVVWSSAAPSDTGAIDLWLDAVNAASADTSGRIAELLLQRDMPWARPGPMGVVSSVPEHHLGMYGADDSRVPANAAVSAAQISSGAPLGRAMGSLPVVHAAAEANNVPLLQRLRAVGAPLEDTVEYRGTPLTTASMRMATGAAEWLIANGANPLRGGDRSSAVARVLEELPRSDGQGEETPQGRFARQMLRNLTPAQLTQSGDVSWLLDAITFRLRPAVPELRALTARGWKPGTIVAERLSSAIVDRDSALVDWLLANGVRFTPSLDSSGSPLARIGAPLMVAVENEDVALVQRLLRAGATIATAGTHDGLTPLAIALQMRNNELAGVLRAAGDSLERIPTPLLVGLSISAPQPELRSALQRRTDLPVHSLPAWTQVGRRLLQDSTVLPSLVPALVAPDATLLRYSDMLQERDSTHGSLLELLLKAASEEIGAPADAPRVDAQLVARLGVLQRIGVLPALLTRLDEPDAPRQVSAAVLTMSVGMRRSTLALLNAMPVLGTRTGTLVLGLAVCQQDTEIAVLLRRRGAVALPPAQQKEFCEQMAAPRRR